VIHPHNILDKRIGISVLNWGLGHVTRSIPIIQALCRQNNKLFIFCNGQQKLIFSQYLQDVTFVHHEGYPFKFNGKGRFKMDILLKSIKLYKFLRSEKQLARTYVEKHRLDMLISDQRYGFISNFVPSIFITHQLQLPVSGMYKLGNVINRRQILNFSSIWIMDDEQKRFAGKLSLDNKYTNALYIGCHSRFQSLDKSKAKRFRGILVFNGPEVYSKTLLETFAGQIENGEIENIVGPESVRSLLQEKNIKTRFFPSTDMTTVDALFLTTSQVFGFFGYSTLMDCLELGCNYNLIPTPGQDEQLYLAVRHKKSL
tara:strand:+ start:1794 stop:2735 length:942 start_codon:yes stop_codon:yes gene_type:complete